MKEESNLRIGREIIVLILIAIMFYVGYKVGYYRGCATTGFNSLECYEEALKHSDSTAYQP